MNNFTYLARFGGHGGGAVVAVLFIALLGIAVLAIFSSNRDTGTDKK